MEVALSLLYRLSSIVGVHFEEYQGSKSFVGWVVVLGMCYCK